MWLLVLERLVLTCVSAVLAVQGLWIVQVASLQPELGRPGLDVLIGGCSRSVCSSGICLVNLQMVYGLFYWV